MGEMHHATIEWQGDVALATIFLAAASRPNCKAEMSEEGGAAKLEITVSNSNLQTLRDIVDELLIALADIEENA
ncbi:MAG: hypothetical protein O3B00_06670 [archaeon]|jgi:hypothetical protein|nr:hypothetical protein [archaeon]MDA1131167.1 hypothetical protein [archaeon]